ncbi:MAG: rRNA maturation RNase YbeY [Pseudomonadota bacterium]
MEIDVLIDAPAWADAGLAALAERACPAALVAAGLTPEDYAVSLLGCDDDRIARLNAQFRAAPKPTNVLSWPSEERAPGVTPRDPELGDIAIAYETCRREATDQGKDFSTHVIHLLIHATLHLLGHDHVEDAAARDMESLERDVMARLGLPDPYGDDILASAGPDPAQG